MKDVTVTLEHNTPLYIMDKAIGTCWDKQKDECDVTRIDRVVNKFKHQSTAEHVSYNFFIEGMSRAVLQELARHRIASFSVKSSRYTLKELKEEDSFIKDGVTDNKRAMKYLVYTGDEDVDDAQAKALENLRLLIKMGKSNDMVKTAMPEAYRTKLMLTFNARSLKNFLSLRTDKSAWYQIRDLAHKVADVIPEDHKFLYKGDVKTVD